MKTLIMTATMVAGIALNAANAAPLPEAKPGDAGFSEQGFSRLDDFFAREIAAKRVPGAVVAIARDGKLVHYKAYGQLDITIAKDFAPHANLYHPTFANFFSSRMDPSCYVFMPIYGVADLATECFK